MDRGVLSRMNSVACTHYANPGSLHSAAAGARSVLEAGRKRMQELLCAQHHAIVFTRGGTEACNIAIHQVLGSFSLENPGVTPHVLVSPVEHPAIRETVARLDREGRIVSEYLPTDAMGHVITSSVTDLVRPETALVAVQLVNSELGIIQPIKKISHTLRLIAKNSTTKNFPQLVCDAVQAGGVMDIHVQSLGAQYVALSASKFYGPKSGGILCIPRGATVAPSLLSGGDQEHHLRPGTEDVMTVAGTVAAYESVVEHATPDREHLQQIKSSIIAGIAQVLPASVFTVNPEHTAPHIVHVSVPGYDSEYVVLFCDAVGVELASQSACSAREGGVSHVIDHLWSMRANTDPHEYAHIRISFGRHTTQSHVQRLIKRLQELQSAVYIRSAAPHI